MTNLSKKGKYGYIMLASATDPYLHFEAEENMTRRLLEIIAHYRFPIHLLTRSSLVTRDFDLLHEIDKNAILPETLQESPGRGVLLSFSFSGISDEIATIFEPGATAPTARLKTLKASSDAGFFTGVSMMPLLPFITDTAQHLEDMYLAFKENGAHYVMPASLSLFGDEKVDMLRNYGEGQEVEVAFNISSREFNGKYYHNIDAWKINPLGAATPASGAAPAPAIDDAPAGDDDLPF